jgi:hypothetical protein
VILKETLARVDWSRLSHAYGSADDLPILIERRASGDEATARAASNELWGTVWHQGASYEASAAAVPALAMLARDTATVARLDLVLLLSSIATGRSFVDVHGFGGADQRARELGWVAESHQAVAAAAPSLLDSLATEPRVFRLGLAVGVRGSNPLRATAPRRYWVSTLCASRGRSRTLRTSGRSATTP